MLSSNISPIFALCYASRIDDKIRCSVARLNPFFRANVSTSNLPFFRLQVEHARHMLPMELKPPFVSGIMWSM
jgi:hypothetical protein